MRITSLKEVFSWVFETSVISVLSLAKILLVCLSPWSQSRRQIPHAMTGSNPGWFRDKTLVER